MERRDGVFRWVMDGKIVRNVVFANPVGEPPGLTVIMTDEWGRPVVAASGDAQFQRLTGKTVGVQFFARTDPALVDLELLDMCENASAPPGEPAIQNAAEARDLSPGAPRMEPLLQLANELRLTLIPDEDIGKVPPWQRSIDHPFAPTWLSTSLYSVLSGDELTDG